MSLSLRERILLGLAAHLVISTPSIAAQGGAAYSSKISLRVNAGMLQNTGSMPGSALSLTALDLNYLHFLSTSLAVGLGYYVALDLAQGMLPLNGFNISARNYFIGGGTHSQTIYPSMLTDRYDRQAYYYGMEFTQRGFYKGSNQTNTTDQVTGNYFALDALIGADIRLNRSYQLNVEGSMSLFAFASSDDRVRIKSNLLHIGVSYSW